jgi:hypothetical protein
MAKWLPSAAVSALLATHALAADVESQIRNTFIEPWAQAMQSKDPEKLVRFLHPQVQACRNAQTKEFFDDALARTMQDKIAPGYKITKIAPIEGPTFLDSMLPADSFTRPVQATYEANIQSGTTTFVFYLAPVNGWWYQVIPCPNEKGVAQVHEGVAMRAEQEKRAAQLVSELKDPLLSELKGMIQREESIDAIHRYQAATGADLTTAHEVIEKLRSPH